MSREMKDSGIDWIGRIPENWVCCKQKHVMTMINGRAYKDSEFENNGKYRILRVGNVYSNPVWYSSSLELPDDKYCNDGDLLYTWSMSYGPVIWRGEKVIYHYHIWKVALDPSLDKMFAYYYLSALTEAIMREVHETTMGFVTMNSMNNAYIAYPDIIEQKIVAECLDSKCSIIDSAISKHQQIIEKLEEYRKAVITQAVTKGLNPNVEMKDSDDETIHEIPSHWLWTRVKFSVTVVRGGSPRPIEQYVIGEKEDGYNWIKIGDATGGGKYILSTKQRIKPEGLSKTRLVHSGTLLLTNSMSFGHPYFLQIDGCIHDGWLAFSDYKGINPMFLYYYLMAETTAHQFTTTADGSVVQNLNIDKVKNSHIALPPMNEQAEIAAYLDERCEMIDTLIEKHNQLISKLQEYKQSLIYNAVTGKIDCTAEA
jgi:type I restriction enzyme S subunit